MWYTLGYAKTHLYPSLDRGRAAGPARGVAVVQCVCVAPLSNPAGQYAGPECSSDRRGPGLQRSDGPQCHSGLPYAGSGGVDAAVLCPPADPTCGLRRHPARAVVCPVAPVPSYLWQTDQPVDPPPGGRSGGCRGHYVPAPPWRSQPPRAGAFGRPGAAGQTVDHQPRPSIRPEKKQRDRLIRLAATHPTWVLGFEDEVWWSRLAQPALHAWAPDAQALHLVEKK